MARYKHTDAEAGQGMFLSVNLKEQLLPGSFEHMLDGLIGGKIDVSTFDKNYKNDETGATAIPPAALMKLIIYGYSKGIRSSLENAARSYANAQTQQEVELQRVINSILAQSTSVLSTRRSLELTQRNNDIVTERFRLSQSSVLETIDASTQLINSRNSHINARYSFLRALSELRSLCALDDEEKLLSILAGNF